MSARVTLARALSKLGAASRTEARQLVADGRVRVDGRIARDPDLWLDLDVCTIELDGAPVGRAATVWFALHKPRGVVTTRSDERGRATVYDLLPDGAPFVAPVGRLDLDSSGLLLLTNDSRLASRVTAPSSGCAKVYEVVLAKPLTAADAAAFAAGFELDGERLAPVRVVRHAREPTRATFTLTEGKNRQIRRMCEARGLEVQELHRTAIGPVELGELAPEACRALTERELDALRAAVAAPRRRQR